MRLALVVLLAMGGSAAANPVQDQVAACWSPPTDSVNAGTIVHIDVRIDDVGDLVDYGVPADASEGDQQWRAMVEASARATRRCAPFDAPAGDYRLTFPPNDTVGQPLDPFTPLPPLS